MPTENFSIIAESLHILNKNIEECRIIFDKEDKSPNDIADFLISLHLVLEISINALIRDVVVNNLQKTIDKSKIVENLDRISFIDKTTLFVYMEKYTFSNFEEVLEADKHHSIIGIIKKFAETRNFLMHGSMIGGFLDGRSSNTVVVSRLTNKHMDDQVDRFKKICDGMKFYLKHLTSHNSDIKGLENRFLSYEFIESDLQIRQ